MKKIKIELSKEEVKVLKHHLNKALPLNILLDKKEMKKLNGSPLDTLLKKLEEI
tara:strand:+ start:44 stop:205 length:162 start_codon:yes stop_codon:yes gene_type:complete